MKRTIVIVTSLIIFIIILFFFYFKSLKNEKKITQEEENLEENTSASNIIENVEYSSKDAKGNEYIIRAETGEIDINENNVIFLKKVSAVVNLVNSKKVLIFADYGKYNINNYDTIFSKNVIIEYLDKKINSEYLDFSIERKSMIISKNVIYKDIVNSMKADVIELDLESKDIKIERTGILWLKAHSRGPSKQKKVIQGKGWKLLQIDDIEKNFKLFEMIYELYKLENPVTEPIYNSYPTTLKL